MSIKYINTTRAVVLALVLGTFGFVWSTFYTDAPYSLYITLLLGALGGISVKRYKEKVNGVGYGGSLSDGHGNNVEAD